MATGTVQRERDVTVPDAPAWGSEPGYRDSWPTALQSDLLRAALMRDERGLAAWRRVRPALSIADMDSGVQAVLPQLRANLLRLGINDPLMELFKGVHRHAWARNQLMLAQVMPVVSDLEDAGVPTLMLKGAALMAEGRHDAGIREMTDIDVLVPTGSVADACQVLAACGMRPVENVPIWFVTDYWAPRVRHSANFENAAGGQLDLHWHALLLSRHDDADTEFWTAAQSVSLRQVSTRTLCPADELLLVILHGLGWAPTPTYRWALDATLIARGACGEVDYDRLAEQARRRWVAPALRMGLRLPTGGGRCRDSRPRPESIARHGAASASRARGLRQAAELPERDRRECVLPRPVHAAAAGRGGARHAAGAAPPRGRATRYRPTRPPA